MAHDGSSRGGRRHEARGTARRSEHGEIVVRRNVVMRGYYKDSEATAAAIKGGWLRTGDVAVVHVDGYMEIRDRRKDIIITGGENISSVEVEQILLRHRPSKRLASSDFQTRSGGRRRMRMSCYARRATSVGDGGIGPPLLETSAVLQTGRGTTRMSPDSSVSKSADGETRTPTYTGARPASG
jgi:acyl-CoA synthetase (AMP-forming)/AMP-acid ligase II